MPIIDNGDIVRAVGFVAIYGAYLEDRIAELVDICEHSIDLRKNIHKLSSTDQARHLLSTLKNEFNNIPDYPMKKQDFKQISRVLEAVKGHLKARHYVIHSILISKSGSNVIMRKNRRTNTEEQVDSKEVIDLANSLFSLQTGMYGLKFPVQRLLVRR